MNSISKKKIIGFTKEMMLAIVLYFIASVIMEGVVIFAFSIAGYDVLHGDLPDSIVTAAAPLYGFVGYSIIVIFVWVKIKKNKLIDMALKLDKNNIVLYFFLYIMGALFVLGLITFFGIFKIYKYNGVSNFSIIDILILVVGYMIQGFGEEIFCRGYVQHVIERKYNRCIAILASCVIFTLPHLTSVIEYKANIALVSICNLFLVSVLFSYIMIKCNSVLAAAGFHAGWNIMLNVIFGLTLSGLDSSTCVFEINVAKDSIVAGSSYGIEASVVLTIVLIILDTFLILREKKENGRK